MTTRNFENLAFELESLALDFLGHVVDECSKSGIQLAISGPCDAWQKRRLWLECEFQPCDIDKHLRVASEEMIRSIKHFAEGRKIRMLTVPKHHKFIEIAQMCDGRCAVRLSRSYDFSTDDWKYTADVLVELE